MSTEISTTGQSVRYANGFSAETDPVKAAEAISQEIVSRFKSTPVHVTMVFATVDRFAGMGTFLHHLQENLKSEILLGCTAETLIYQDRELEGQSGIVVWSASLPGSVLEAFHLEFSKTSEGILCEGFPEHATGDLTGASIFLLCDPFTTPQDIVINELAERFPGVPVYGGMASGFERPQESQIVYQGQVFDYGAVGVLIKQGPMIRSLVSQGCRPIGQPYVITKGNRNLIASVGGHPVIEKLNETVELLGDDDRELLRYGLFMGVVMNEYQESFGYGDFLIMNVLGVDEESGQMAVGGRIRTGQTVQFHLRDANSADEDFKGLIRKDQAAHGNGVHGGLLFSCNGRGTRLFPSPNHDASLINSEYQNPVVAGFFAQGELGPVGKKNFLHGFTASVALFE
ncbi:FIST signal transduction protein [Lacunimicrobium album]